MPPVPPKLYLWVREMQQRAPQLADPWVEDVFWAMGGIVVRMPLRASAVDGRMAGFKS